MIKAKRIHYDEHGYPTLTIVVDGHHDIYRFSHHLLHGQCEFADVGYKIQQRQKRRLGKQRWKMMLNRMHGDGNW